LTFLLDTNVLSETVRPIPSLAVEKWFKATDESDLFISVVTLAEIRDGIELMQAGKKRERLDRWLTFELPNRFDGRTLNIDSATAIECGRIMARQNKAGRAVDAMDAFIAAAAICHDLTLVTRNTADFENLGLRLINPWIDAGP
jgi:predicted nucleic acid-binding protein